MFLFPIVTLATTRSLKLRMGHLKVRHLSMSFTSQPIRLTLSEVGCSAAWRDYACCEWHTNTSSTTADTLLTSPCWQCFIFYPSRMLRNNKISCIHNDSFTGLHNVRLLSLYDNQLTTISPGAFDTLQTLSTLWELYTHTPDPASTMRLFHRSYNFLCSLSISNLLANSFNCDCRLAWLGDWLRSRKIVTGNPRCQRPAFLKEIPLQDVALPDFRCEDGGWYLPIISFIHVSGSGVLLQFPPFKIISL